MEKETFENCATEEEQKNYIWNSILLEDYSERYDNADSFFAAVPLTPTNVNFYLRDNGDFIAHLVALAPNADDKSLLAKYQRAFIIAANNAYQDPKEESSYLNKLDLVAVDLNTIVTKINAGAFDDIPSLVKIINTTIKNAHKDRPIDNRQNAFNIAAMIGYLAISATCLALYFTLPVAPLAFSIVAGVAALGALWVGLRSSFAISNTKRHHKHDKILCFKFDTEKPISSHTLFTPKTEPLHNAKAISNIVRTNERGHRISEGLKNLMPKPKFAKV